MSDITDYWRLDTTQGELPMDYRATTARTPMPGESMDLPLTMSGYSDAADNSWPDWRERYRILTEEYGPQAGEIVIHDPEGAAVGYTEQHNRASLVVAIRPPSNVARSIGSWAIIESMSDTYLLRGKATLGLSVVYLASLDEFGTRSDLAQDLEAPTLI